MNNLTPEQRRERYNNSNQGRINAALGVLMQSLGLQGESGTEYMFQVLHGAVNRVDWGIVEQSHRDGPCYDVNCLLAEAIEAEMLDNMRPAGRA